MPEMAQTLTPVSATCDVTSSRPVLDTREVCMCVLCVFFLLGWWCALHTIVPTRSCFFAYRPSARVTRNRSSVSWDQYLGMCDGVRSLGLEGADSWVVRWSVWEELTSQRRVILMPTRGADLEKRKTSKNRKKAPTSRVPCVPKMTAARLRSCLGGVQFHRWVSWSDHDGGALEALVTIAVLEFLFSVVERISLELR